MMAAESRAATMRRMVREERCSAAEVARFFGCAAADVRWALRAKYCGRAVDSGRMRFPARAGGSWIRSSIAAAPRCNLTPSIGLQVRA